MADDLLIRLDDDVTQRLTMAAETLHRAPSEIVHSAICDEEMLLSSWSRAALDVLREADFTFTISNDKSQNRTCLYLIVKSKTAYRSSFVEAEVQRWEEWVNATLRNRIDRWHLSPDGIDSSTSDRDGVPAVPKKPRPKGIGRYHSGHSDTSQRIDELVAEMLDER